MSNLSTKLYASQGNGGSSSVSIEEIGEILIPLVPPTPPSPLPAPTASVRGGVLLQARITPTSSTVPAAAPAGGTGTEAGAWDTSANRDAAIATINGLVPAVTELQTKVNGILTALKSAGLLTP